jgi:rhodanese-related sulfurtransferase
MTDNPAPLTASRSEQRAGRILVGAIVALVVATFIYFALGMPGMDHSAGSSMDGMSMTDTPGESTLMNRATSQLVDPARFERAVSAGEAVVINVHTPYEGEIGGTDLFMAFDNIDPELLPTDRGTQLAVYCRSGNMSAAAVESLTRLGYTDIIELDGGMNTWIESGRQLSDRL